MSPSGMSGNADEVAKRLLLRVKKIQDNLAQALADSAEEWENKLKGSFKMFKGDPVGPGIHVRSGFLRNSIRFNRSGRGLKTRVAMFTAGVPYARIHAFPRALKGGGFSNSGKARLQFFETWGNLQARRTKRLRRAVREGLGLK